MSAMNAFPVRLLDLSLGVAWNSHIEWLIGWDARVLSRR